MDRVKGYLQTPTSYPQDQYETFLSTVESAITTFEKRNGFPQKEADTPRFGDHHQEELDRLNMELLSYVTLFDSKEEYIDIPIEILDFRADNVLFQSTAYYGLRFDKRDFVVGTERYNLYKDLLNLPGQLWPTPPALLTADAASYVREGLTKPALVNGNLVYEEGTIDYVAHALTKIPIAATYDTLVPGWNDSFRTLQNSEGFILGSWADTQKKIVDETGRITGRNGDHLPYSSVSTAYDLAYYLLTYLWKPVPETDAELLGGGYRYNMQIPERQVARLYKGSNGFYTLNAETSIGYAGKYVLNATETQPGKNYYYQPFFSPIDGLGFETPGVTPKNHDTDSGCRDGLLNGFNSGGSNYLYTMHARGSFVYFHDEYQEFTFVGDDDVYFCVHD